ncbi:cupin domain-containing protein [uncultured Mucilaginibacter sp.]|uniref:cupin domain-containing protein n=1 Tax=uncultured Mucilaginibacter sp. TaxID=797541 RepID=UPI0025CDE875|nr:cupin domain-containing protein [uncultured Mucilaginibacter sp.]
MPTGTKLYNPLTQKTFHVLHSAQDTGGEYVRFKCVANAESKKKSGFVHIHPSQTEIITVESGSMIAVVNGKKVRYDAGEMLVIKPGDAHQWWNASTTQELTLITEIRPALKTEQLYRTTCAFAQAKHNDSANGPNLLHLAVMLDHYSDMYVVAGKWTLLKKAAFKVMATIGRLKGYTAELPYKQLATNTGR